MVRATMKNIKQFVMMRCAHILAFRCWRTTHVVIIVTALSMALNAQAAPSAAPASTPSESDKRYQQCTTLASSDAAFALRSAEAWLKEGETPAARHCRALALFTLKRYSESAEDLGALSRALGRNNVELWASVMQQMATAQNLGNQPAKAVATLSETLRYVGERERGQSLPPARQAELLRERARLYRAQNTPLAALQDIDHALSLAPENTELRLYLAEIYLELKDRDSAKRALEELLKRAPDNARAKELLAGIAP